VNEFFYNKHDIWLNGKYELLEDRQITAKLVKGKSSILSSCCALKVLHTIMGMVGLLRKKLHAQILQVNIMMDNPPYT
jgi:hypothetical protein